MREEYPGLPGARGQTEHPGYASGPDDNLPQMHNCGFHQRLVAPEGVRLIERCIKRVLRRHGCSLIAFFAWGAVVLDPRFTEKMDLLASAMDQISQTLFGAYLCS